MRIRVNIERRTLNDGRTSYRLYWNQNGERQPKINIGVMDEKEAQKAADRKERELNGLPTQAKRNGLITSIYVEQYLRWYKAEKARSTYDRVKRAFDVFLLPEFGNLAIDDLSVAGLREYRVKRLSGEIVNAHNQVAGKTTVDKEIQALKRMLEYAVENGDLAANPLVRYKVAKPKTAKKPTMFNVKQLEKLYSASKPTEHAAWWKLFANTGMRRAEAVKMRWDDISEGVISIESLEDDERTKSGKFRDIPILGGAKEALKIMGNLYGKGEFVFPRFKKSSYTQAAKRDIRLAGLDGSLKTLRHSFCTLMLRAGYDLETVREYMGHEKITTTQIYLHHDPAGITKAGKLNF